MQMRNPWVWGRAGGSVFLSSSRVMETVVAQFTSPVADLRTRLRASSSSCGQDEPILTPHQNCFFDLLFCFCCYHHTSWPASGNPAPLPDCETKCLCPGPAHLWRAERRAARHPVLKACLLEDSYKTKINGLFIYFLEHPPHLPSIKESGIQAPRKMVILRQ